jgi:hypothetical protein
MGRKVANQTARLVAADVRREEMLAVQVGVFHNIMIEDANAAYTFAAQAFADLTAKAAAADQIAIGIREARLIKSGDQFLAMSHRKPLVSRRHQFGLDFNV